MRPWPGLPVALPAAGSGSPLDGRRSRTNTGAFGSWGTESSVLEVDDAAVPFEELMARISKSKAAASASTPTSASTARASTPRGGASGAGGTTAPGAALVASAAARTPAVSSGGPHFAYSDGCDGGRLLESNPGYLPVGRILAAWDMERIMSPERTWATTGRVEGLFHDHQRQGLPAWRPCSRGAAVGPPRQQQHRRRPRAGNVADTARPLSAPRPAPGTGGLLAGGTGAAQQRQRQRVGSARRS